MALTSGTISLVQKYADKLDLAITAATGGTSPYSYQWYKSTTSGFSPDESNKVSGATGLQATITGLIPGQQYYFKVVSTDEGASGATVTSDQFAAQTDTQLYSQNQFAQTAVLGMIDKRFSINSIEATAGGDLVAGQAVKFGAGNKVTACTANTDRVDGFVVFNPVHTSYKDGDRLTIARAGSYITLRATSSLTAGDPAAIDPSCIGGVTAIVSTESPAIQTTVDAAAGDLISAYVVAPAL